MAASDSLIFTLDVTGLVTARSARAGETRWTRAVGGWRSPGLCLEGGRLFAAAREDSVLALAAHDGSVIWRSSVAGRFATTPVRCGQLLALATEAGPVAWLDAETGTLVARTPRMGAQLATGVASAGRLLTVSTGGVVECAGPSPAAEDWHLDLESAVVAAPVLARDHLLVATARGQIRVLGARDGRPLGAYQAGGGFRVPPLFDRGRLILSDEKGNVHAYRF